MISNIYTQYKSMVLNRWDKLFLIVFAVVTAFILINGTTALTIGGLILIYGAFLTYKGQIFLSVSSYILADICWIYNAIVTHDVMGAVSITVGITFGILASYKMNNGQMEKDLSKK